MPFFLTSSHTDAHIGPEMKECRWQFGLCRIRDSLFAVSGCGQSDSIEALTLNQEPLLSATWQIRASFKCTYGFPNVMTF